VFSSPWKKAFVPLLGETRSLDGLEHQLIRGSGRYNDPRIHFAAKFDRFGRIGQVAANAFTVQQVPKIEEQQALTDTRLPTL
jgi:hypothetical protein